MRTLCVLVLAVALLAVAVEAQTAISLPAFGSTFSSASLTRGFYFQAPVAFTILGLKVPDESAHGKQNVAVYKLTGVPPTYPTSTLATGTLLFHQFGTASSVIIPCSITFNKGDYVGILGACGDSTTMRNSYSSGSGPYATTVLGQATSLTRFITQTNLVTAKALGAYSASTGAIGRVRVYVVNAASIVGSGTGKVGTALAYALSAPSDAGLPYQVANSFGTGPIPIDARKLGLSADNLMVVSTSGLAPTVFSAYAGNLDTKGAATATLNIPNITALIGYRINTAFVTLKASAPSGLSTISATHTFTIS